MKVANDISTYRAAVLVRPTIDCRLYQYTIRNKIRRVVVDGLFGKVPQ